MAIYTYTTVLLVIICSYHIHCDSDLNVRIQNGLVKGKYEETSSGKQFASFIGIPFGKPPVGELRFQPPQPIENWDGIVDATSDKAVCVQPSGDGATGQEDCLFINVYTPADFKENKTYAVMVWIYGGAFKGGTGNRDAVGPQLLMEHDIVLVSMNYRVGIFGFLSTGNRVASGNNGLKDQLLALKWVKNNINYFGGDPETVTVAGQSAGSVSTHFLMLSPLSKGLFGAVISQSGGALSDWGLHTPQEALDITEKLAATFNCPSNPQADMIKCLQDAGPYEMIENLKYLWDWFDVEVLFRPVVEEKHEGAVLTDYPVNIIESGKQLDVPWLVGFTKDEGCIRASNFYASPKILEDLDTDFDNRLLHTLVSNDSKLQAATQKIRQFYFGEDHLQTNRQGIIDLYTDGMFAYSVDEMIRLHRKNAKNPVFYYVVSYRGNRSMSGIFGDKEHDYGVCHGDDLFYLFVRPFGGGGEASENDIKVSKIMTKLWTNFVKYHNPTPSNAKNEDVKWEPISSENHEYLNIGGPEDNSMKANIFKERFDFWKSLNVKPKPYDSNRATSANFKYSLFLHLFCICIALRVLIIES